MSEIHKPLTTVTWDDYPVFDRNSKSCRVGMTSNPIGWDEESDLEDQFCELGYDREMVRALMYGARSGLPVRLTWDTPMGDGFHANTERKTVYVIIEYILRPYGNNDRLHVRYCGFGHDIYLNQIVSAVIPSAEIEYL